MFDCSKVKGVDNQERLVYQIIEEAGNKGIWIRDIRLRSNLLLTQLNKILKTLESRNLIKAVKSVGVSSGAMGPVASFTHLPEVITSTL